MLHCFGIVVFYMIFELSVILYCYKEPKIHGGEIEIERMRAVADLK